ncbi:hypothetical protein OROHE_003367 [Orobanche hederae]
MMWCYIALKQSKKKPARLIRNTMTREIKEIGIDQSPATRVHNNYMYHLNNNEKDSDKLLIHMGHYAADSDSLVYLDDSSIEFGGNKGCLVVNQPNSSYPINPTSPLAGCTELSHLDWGHWFTLRDLEIATDKFSTGNIIGEGGYGIVYLGRLVNGTIVAVKRLLNHLGQAEKEFRVEVEAIGHVRHKNLVRLLGYCIEGTHRLLVYEYVNNGNLEQWLHGGMSRLGHLTWDERMKILLGTAKALAYLHDAIEPKVVHRDIKASNILIDDDFNAKLSDFGLAKLLRAGKSHIFTRVMGTFGYVAPEYASSGYLNEKSDVYSFGVVLLEAITGRDPVDDSRPVHEKNLVEWLKMMVGGRRSEEVVDPQMKSRPSTSSLKRALLTALRCVDPNALQRPTMSQVVRMLESEEYPIPREGRKRQKEKLLV